MVRFHMLSTQCNTVAKTGFHAPATHFRTHHRRHHREKNHLGRHRPELQRPELTMSEDCGEKDNEFKWSEAMLKEDICPL